MAQPQYLIFDSETVVDGRLVQQIRYPDQPQLTAQQAIAQHRQELLERSNSDFIPHTFQVPVSIAIAKVAADFSLQDVITLDRPKFRPQVIADHFWRGWQHYGCPTLVSFNGRGFDMPLLEMAAFRYGISVPQWFNMNGPGYTQPRNRFNAQAHLDLQEFMTNFSAVRQHSGLNLLAQMLGKPGKLDTKGDMVQDLYEAGEHQRIDDYCFCDACDTYFVLRVQLMLGQLSVEREHQLVAQAQQVIAAQADEFPAARSYLESFRFWQPYEAESSPFVDHLAVEDAE